MFYHFEDEVRDQKNHRYKSYKSQLSSIFKKQIVLLMDPRKKV